MLLGYSLGKAQEILCSLDGAGLNANAARLGLSDDAHLRAFRPIILQILRYNPNDVAGKVLICPPSTNHSQMLEKIPHKRVAMISGWAVDPNAVYRYQVDAAFPLSDHADYDDLIRYVELDKAATSIDAPRFAAAFASDLRKRGIEAWALSEENQMELYAGTTFWRHFRRRIGL